MRRPEPPSRTRSGAGGDAAGREKGGDGGVAERGGNSAGGGRQVGEGRAGDAAADVDVLDGGRELSRTPRRVVAQRADEVGHARTLHGVHEGHGRGVARSVGGQDDRGRGRREEVVHAALARDEAGGADGIGEERILAVVRVFHRDRGRPAAGELLRPGEQVRGGEVGAQRRADDLVVGGVEVEERGGATGGQAGELHERLVDVHEVLDAAELVLAGAGIGVADTQVGAGGEFGVAGATGGVEAQEGAQRAVAGLGAGVDVEAREAGEAREVTAARNVAAVGADVAVFGASAARDAQAGVGARDVEEAGTVGGADADVLDRNRLLHRQVGGLSPAHDGQPRRRTQEKALDELHCETSRSFETHGIGLLLGRPPSGEPRPSRPYFPWCLALPAGTSTKPASGFSRSPGHHGRARPYGQQSRPLQKLRRPASWGAVAVPQRIGRPPGRLFPRGR